jgi:hypothetical protein
VAVVVGVVYLLRGSDLLATVLVAMRSSITFFIGWAIARDYDPDHPYSAILAAFAMLATQLLGYSANLLFLALLLLMLRYINRSTGVAATFVDLAAGLALTAWLSWTMDWTVGLLAALGYTLDGLKSERRDIRFGFAGVALLIELAATFYGTASIAFYGIDAGGFALSALFLLFSIPLFIYYRDTVSAADQTGEKLDPTRIRSAQFFYVVSVVLISLKLGLQRPAEMLAAGSIIITTSIFYLLSTIFPPLRPEVT